MNSTSRSQSFIALNEIMALVGTLDQPVGINMSIQRLSEVDFTTLENPGIRSVQNQSFMEK